MNFLSSVRPTISDDVRQMGSVGILYAAADARGSVYIRAGTGGAECRASGESPHPDSVSNVSEKIHADILRGFGKDW